MEAINENLDYKVFTRIGKTRYNELSNLLEHSPYRTMSALIRHILMHGKITLLTRDTSLGEVMEKLSRICTELNAIGININQVTKKIYADTLPHNQPGILLEATEFNRQADQRVRELLELIAKLSYQWLPE